MIHVERKGEDVAVALNGTAVEIFSEAAILVDNMAEQFKKNPVFKLNTKQDAVEFVITGIYESIIAYEKKNRP